MSEQPSIGRMVHYTSYGTPGGEYGQECRAAVITETGGGDTVGLAVLNPTGQFFNRQVPHDDTDRPGPGGRPGGTWHWPEHK